MSKTTDNLKAAFAGESQARNKYTFFAEVAREEGYHYIAKIFEETAFNEMQHAKDHLKLLNGIGDTVANLKEAFGGEDHEVESMYPGFAAEAAEEGEAALPDGDHLPPLALEAGEVRGDVRKAGAEEAEP